MVTFNDVKIADVGYYINLDSRVDRKDNLESQFNKFNIKGVNRFSAFSSYPSNPSNCKKSHYQLFELFLQSNYNTMLVLEDDCKFLDFLKDESTEIFDKILNTDWDLFWLGCRNRKPPKNYINNCYFTSSTSGAQSYIITKRFVEYLLATFPIEPNDNLRNTSIDELLCLSIYDIDVVNNPNKYNFYNLEQPLDNLQTKFKSLCYEKALTTQYLSYSDLWGTTTDLEYYMISSHPKQ